jgi:hypothetical protein
MGNWRPAVLILLKPQPSHPFTRITMKSNLDFAIELLSKIDALRAQPQTTAVRNRIRRLQDALGAA